VNWQRNTLQPCALAEEEGRRRRKAKQQCALAYTIAY